MAFDTHNKRLSIIGWSDGVTLQQPDGDVDVFDRLAHLGLPTTLAPGMPGDMVGPHQSNSNADSTLQFIAGGF